MAVLPTPCSIKLHPTMPVSKASLVITTRRNLPRHFVASATITATPQEKTTSYQTKKNLRPDSSSYNSIAFREFSLSQNYLVTDNFLNKDPKSEEEAEGILEREVGIVIQRLEAVVERVTEMEIQKFKSRIKGEISYDENMLVENISRVIVSKFLEKPLKYLTISDGNLDQKLKDLNFLVGILEDSCLTKEKMKVHA